LPRQSPLVGTLLLQLARSSGPSVAIAKSMLGLGRGTRQSSSSKCWCPRPRSACPKRVDQRTGSLQRKVLRDDGRVAFAKRHDESIVGHAVIVAAHCRTREHLVPTCVVPVRTEKNVKVEYRSSGSAVRQTPGRNACCTPSDVYTGPKY
jgi:hypothetical protein